MLNIKQYEKVEKEVLNFLMPKAEMTHRMDRVDLFHKTLNGNNIIGEFKHRNINNHDDFDWILEVEKYKAIINKKENTKDKTLYINLFKDDVILIWDLNVITEYNYRSTLKLVNKTTAQGFTQSGEKVWKHVFLLKNEHAQYKIKYK